MRTKSGKNLTFSNNMPVQALAELSPIIPETYFAPDRMGIDLERMHALYGEIYRRQPWVRTCIDKRANAVARLPVEVWDCDGDTKTLDTTSGYARLLQSPCYRGYLSPYSFWLWVSTMLDIFGEAYLAIVRDGNGAPVGLAPMHPSRVLIQRETGTGCYTYFFQAGPGMGGTTPQLVSFEQEDVVPFRLTFPDRTERGLSRLESVAQTLAAEDSSRTAVNSMWRHGGRPNLILETPSRISDVGAERLRQAFEQAHKGSENAGQVLVLEDGVNAKPFQCSAVDLQLVESRRLNREEICAVFDIAPTLVGILDHATFSNITEQMRGFYRDTMAPVLRFIEDTLDAYVGSYWNRSNTMVFDTSDVLRGDFEMRMQAAHDGVCNGILTPNEGRQILGYNRFDDPRADQLYANSAVQQLGTPGGTIRMNESATGTTPDGETLSRQSHQVVEYATGHIVDQDVDSRETH